LWGAFGVWLPGVIMLIGGMLLQWWGWHSHYAARQAAPETAVSFASKRAADASIAT